MPSSGGIFDWDTIDERLAELNHRAEDPDLWTDPTVAQKVMRERQLVDKQANGFRDLEQKFEDAVTLIELGEMEEDADAIAEGEAALRDVRDLAQRQEVEALLSGELDGNDTYLYIQAGSGGTESQDWAAMLARMYLRWAERRGFKVTMLDESPGEEAGIKSATFEIRGENAYGWLKTERGVHRLVRISPFDSNARRHTSFAAVKVSPVLDDSIEIDVNESDCRIDTYRASGAGGQHVNTTDSAVRITHMPSGVVVACQQERSQHKNRATAWSMLKARLYELEIEKREAKASAEAAALTDIAWGHQIRSYVLQPYQMVKDVRTGVESSDPAAVLDGDLDQFIEAALAERVEGAGQSEIEDLQ